MNQWGYLSQTLWDFRDTFEYTDVTLFCADGSLAAHLALLAPIFTSFGISFPFREEVPDCLFLPDLGTLEMLKALEALYLQNDARFFVSNFEQAETIVKQELLDFLAECKTKVEVDKYEEPGVIHLDITGGKSEGAIVESYELKNEYIPDNSLNMEFNERKNGSSERNVIPSNNSEKTKRPRSKHGCLKYGCREECGTKAKLKIHMKESHGYTFMKNIQCPYCKKVSRNDLAYTTHLAVMHRKEVLINHTEISLNKACLNCKLKFLNMIDLEKHSLSVHKVFVQSYKCNICKVETGGKHALTKHKKKNHLEEVVAMGLTGYKKTKPCHYCEKYFTSSPQLRNHIYTHHKDKRVLHPEIVGLHKCEECNETFHTSAARNSHMTDRHTPNSKCNLCEKICSSLFVLNGHQRNVHDNTEHTCHLCNKKIKGKRNLYNHFKRHEGVKSTYKYKCTLCTDGQFQAEETLQKHIKDCHSGIKYKCLQCPLGFQSKKARRGHENIHHAEKTVPCGQCDQMFARKAYRKVHIKTYHTRKKEDKICTLCGEAFWDKVTFEAHGNRHTNNRLHECEICGKTFLVQSHLKSHFKVHTLPHKCDKCDKGYKDVSLLRDHVRKVHEGLKIECRFGCGWQAADKRAVYRHETQYCKLNPLPNAPYSIAIGTANKLTLQNFHAKEKEYKS